MDPQPMEPEIDDPTETEIRLLARIAELEGELKYANKRIGVSERSIENYMLNASYWEDCLARLVDALKDALKQATKYGYNAPNIGEHDD